METTFHMDLATNLATLNISSENDEFQKLFNEFLEIMDETKKKKRAIKILATTNYEALFSSSIEKWLCEKLSSSDFTVLKKVSCLLELSTTTREVVKRNFKHLCAYLANTLSTFCNEEKSREKFLNCEKFNECSMLTVKLCLQVIQFLPDEVSDVICNQTSDSEIKDIMEVILDCILTVLSSKRFSKECSLLSGTVFALLYNLCGNDGKTLLSITNLLTALDMQSDIQCGSIVLGSISMAYPKEVTSSYSQLMLINGFACINSNLLLGVTFTNQLLLDTMFNLLDVTHFHDPVSKYMCFQTLLAWLHFLYSVQMNKLMTYYNDGRSLFLKKDSMYSHKILDLVWRHIEDLVDGIPLFVQKIFAMVLKLHNDERCLNDNHFLDDQFYIELTKDALNQAWHVKGRWALLAELIPYVTFKQLFVIQPCLADEMILCMSTCSLTAVSNEVYQVILKDMRDATGHDESTAVKDWSTYFKEPVMKALQSDNALVRQNIGHYWIPSTVRLLPDCLLFIEGDMRSTLMDKKVVSATLLHAYILIVKSCRNFGLIKNNELEERKEVLVKALQHSDLDIRIETFSTLCCNPKKTDPLPISFQHIILDYVDCNLNNDSSRFRQQMLSALKKLLVNIRDSSILLHRKNLNDEKRGITSGDWKFTLMKLVDFVEGFIALSKSCLHPGALFQRRKTGLLLFQLLSELFIFVEKEKQRKKCAAPDSSQALFKFIVGDVCKWKILSSVDEELLSCIEDQHDEIRELALEILNFHQKLSEDRLLLTRETFNKTLNIAQALLDSPKYHETESGAMIIRFIMNRSVENTSIAGNMYDHCQPDAKSSGRNEADYMILCYTLLKRGQNFLKMASKDFLLAACYRPIYGILLAFSEILKSLKNISSLPGNLSSFIKELVIFCDAVSSMAVQLLAGTYVGKDDIENDCKEASPSFADIDEALDCALKQCPSYSSLKESLGHVHCRELLISFCWLNMKAVSFVLSGVGNIMVSINENELAIDTEVLELAYKYYKNSLIKCRHKGVIESSFTSLTHFCKALANITSFWKELVKWCYDVLQAAVDLGQNASVTKRSAGIPMFIQAILSAEPASEHHESLHKCMKYLVDVARTELPTDINFTVDLPQFNAINIMRAIFRDATLGNTVLPFVEDAVMLTINGFSSPSWSIRNASTILLGTLVPRMLGQRISQEENSQQNTSTVDVFFYRYPKLVSYFQTCLLSQVNAGEEYGANFIAPHVIPALTFLSKLSSSSLESGTKLSSIFLPMLNSFTKSPVFTIREIATSSIIAFTPEENYIDLIKEILSNLHTQDDNNKIHSLCTLLIKTLKTARSSKESICHFILNHYKNHDGIRRKFKCDLLSHGVVIELLLECFYILKIHALDILFDHLDKCLTITEQLSHVAVGKPIFLKSLVKVIMAILCENLLEEKGFRILSRVQESCCKDLHILFFNGITQYTESIQKSLNNQIFLFTVKTILASKCKILLEASLSCLDLLLNKNVVSLVKDISELLKCLFQLVNTTQRFIPYLLPSIEKIFKYSQLIFKDEILMTMAATLANLMNEFSCSEQSEHLRLAAARSIGLLEQLIHGYGSYNEERLVEQALHRCVITALRLIQDEDEMIRQETNSHLQFLNITSSGNDHSFVQCNITLGNLIKFVEMNSIHKEMYFRWLVELFVTWEDEDDTHEKCDLMLFEQEASNLYAEEMIVIDLTFRSLKNVFTAVSSEPNSAQLLNSYSRSYKETIFPACKRNIYLLKCSETNYRKYPVKNVYGLFGTRRNFITMYKILKCLLIFQLCVLDEDEKVEIKEFCLDEITSIIGKRCLHPVLKDIYIQLAA